MLIYANFDLYEDGLASQQRIFSLKVVCGRSPVTAIFHGLVFFIYIDYLTSHQEDGSASYKDGFSWSCALFIRQCIGCVRLTPQLRHNAPPGALIKYQIATNFCCNPQDASYEVEDSSWEGQSLIAAPLSQSLIAALTSALNLESLSPVI